VIENLGYSAAAYQAAMESLDRTFGGQQHQVTLYLEDFDSFKPIHSGSPKDIEKFADLLDVAIVNLKEANRTAELQDSMLRIKLQQKLQYLLLCWLTTTDGYLKTIKQSVLKFYLNMCDSEAEFHSRALETIHELSVGRSGKFDVEVMKESPQTFLVDQVSSQKLGMLRGFLRCAKVTCCLDL